MLKITYEYACDWCGSAPFTPDVYELMVGIPAHNTELPKPRAMPKLEYFDVCEACVTAARAGLKEKRPRPAT